MAETLDTLGEKIAALTMSFGEVRKQLDGHDRRFDQIDGRLNQVDGRLDQVDRRLDQVDGRLDQVDKRFGQVDQRLDQFDKRFDQVDRRIDEQGSSLRMLIEAVDSKVDLVLEKVTHLMERDIRNTAAHARFDTRLDNHELRLIALESGHRDSPAPPDEGDRGGS